VLSRRDAAPASLMMGNMMVVSVECTRQVSHVEGFLTHRLPSQFFAVLAES
jgi:hypothetical protein